LLGDDENSLKIDAPEELKKLQDAITLIDYDSKTPLQDAGGTGFTSWAYTDTEGEYEQLPAQAARTDKAELGEAADLTESLIFYVVCPQGETQRTIRIAAFLTLPDGTTADTTSGTLDSFIEVVAKDPVSYQILDGNLKLDKVTIYKRTGGEDDYSEYGYVYHVYLPAGFRIKDKTIDRKKIYSHGISDENYPWSSFPREIKSLEQVFSGIMSTARSFHYYFDKPTANQELGSGGYTDEFPINSNDESFTFATSRRVLWDENDTATHAYINILNFSFHDQFGNPGQFHVKPVTALGEKDDVFHSYAELDIYN